MTISEQEAKLSLMAYTSVSDLERGAIRAIASQSSPESANVP